ncbi:hypothetical protein B0H34DRAFT_801047 [Crassisporium funariophilum]|nr:hypothetical protein B0H34DRAFT_801047 [Crassisporium funariophilum]
MPPSSQYPLNLYALNANGLISAVKLAVISPLIMKMLPQVFVISETKTMSLAGPGLRVPDYEIFKEKADSGSQLLYGLDVRAWKLTEGGNIIDRVVSSKAVLVDADPSWVPGTDHCGVVACIIVAPTGPRNTLTLQVETGHFKPFMPTPLPRIKFPVKSDKHLYSLFTAAVNRLVAENKDDLTAAIDCDDTYLKRYSKLTEIILGAGEDTFGRSKMYKSISCKITSHRRELERSMHIIWLNSNPPALIPGIRIYGAKTCNRPRFLLAGYLTPGVQGSPPPNKPKPWLSTPSVLKVCAQVEQDPFIWPLALLLNNFCALLWKGNPRPSPGPDGWEKWWVKNLLDGALQLMLNLHNYLVMNSRLPGNISDTHLTYFHKRGVTRLMVSQTQYPNLTVLPKPEFAASPGPHLG